MDKGTPRMDAFFATAENSQRKIEEVMKKFRTLILWLAAPFGVAEYKTPLPQERKLQKWEQQIKR